MKVRILDIRTSYQFPRACIEATQKMQSYKFPHFLAVQTLIFWDRNNKWLKKALFMRHDA